MTQNSSSLTPDQAYRRASGRRRYNLQRQNAARKRRKGVARALKVKATLTRQEREQLAQAFGVSKATVNRDIREVLANPAAYRY